MAEQNTVPDENSSFEDKIAYLRSKNISEDKIAQHFTNVDDPNAQAWVRNYKTQQAQTAATQAMGPASTASSVAPNPINTSGVQSLGNAFNNIAQSYADLPMWQQLAIPPAAIATTYVAKKTGDLVFNNLRDRQEVRKQAALNALEPSAAVKVQQDQLKLQQAAQENLFAQQAQQNNSAPVSDPLLDARVQTENQRAASEAARTKAAQAQADLIQEKLIAAQRKAAMVKGNPAGAAAQVAAAEGLPIEAQPTVGGQPSAAKLAETHGLNLPTTQDVATPPANIQPTPVSPETATPSTPAEVVTDPTTTPVEKVVKLTPETPVAGTATETPKVAGAVEPQVLKTGTGKPAYVGEGPTGGKFKSSYSDVKSVPQGYAFVPGAQSINTLRNNIGQETFTQHYTDKPYPSSYAEALQQGKDINTSLGRMSREEMLAKGITPPNVVPGIGAQVGGIKGSRLINVGMNGVKAAGMLVAISDLAKANNLSEAGGKLGEAAINAIPGVGPAAMFYTKNAGAPTLTEENLPQTVRANLETMRQNLSPQDYAKMRDKYLQNVVLNGVAPTEQEKLFSNLQSNYREKPQANTLLPVRPPR